MFGCRTTESDERCLAGIGLLEEGVTVAICIFVARKNVFSKHDVFPAYSTFPSRGIRGQYNQRITWNSVCMAARVNNALILYPGPRKIR